MLNLVRKDFIALKSSFWMSLMYLVVFSVAFIPKMSSSIHLVGIYTAFATIMLGTMIDIKHHNHNFLVTLPIKRKQIVLAKYVSAIIYTVVGVLASYGIHLLVNLYFPELNKPDYSIKDILGPVGITLVLTSIYLPLFYAFSKKGAAIINGIFLILLIALAQPTAIFMNLIREEGSSSSQIFYLVLAGLSLLFMASYYITAKLFTRKDL
ncbi:ABC-2 transporter permease [Paenibacillus sp. UMB4589-SE434]|uniref:ABC-2 transporter permease n=1 Tax=Paenibacillus sp. UMB4589-SE434 TaxID=3046314 RepID=UPI00254C1491|nr:ABC-2 transporter permease [Paenibacillus sp. UMB4589-SE434]MDK8180257.1 ABC-2 transporter permease [Paenibacillus sp. UMB4589-SE434]